MAFEVTGKEGRVGKVKPVGYLGGGQCGGAEQGFGFADGEVGDPIGGHLPGDLLDYFGQILGGDTELAGIERCFARSTEVFVQAMKEAVGYLFCTGSGGSHRLGCVEVAHFGCKDKSQGAQYLPVRGMERAGIMTADHAVSIHQRQHFFFREPHTRTLLHLFGYTGTEHIGIVCHKVEGEGEYPVTKIGGILPDSQQMARKDGEECSGKQGTGAIVYLHHRFSFHREHKDDTDKLIAPGSFGRKELFNTVCCLGYKKGSFHSTVFRIALANIIYIFRNYSNINFSNESIKPTA